MVYNTFNMAAANLATSSVVPMTGLDYVQFFMECITELGKLNVKLPAVTDRVNLHSYMIGLCLESNRCHAQVQHDRQQKLCMVL